MSFKAFPRRIIVFVLFVTTGFVHWVASPVPSLAQCGDYPPDSSCITCHDEAYPVSGKGEWHDIHARKDCCLNCHGGNSQAAEKEQAHAGLQRNPLVDVYTGCYSCHPSDYQDRAERFGMILGIQPAGKEPPTRPAPPTSLPEQERQIVILPPITQVPVSAIPLFPELFFLAVCTLTLLGFISFVRTHAHS